MSSRRRRSAAETSRPLQHSVARQRSCVARRDAAGAHGRAAGAHPVAAGEGERGAHLVVLGRRRRAARLAGRARRPARGREAAPSLCLAPPRAQHYVQSLCQLTVYAYWGWYWPPVYDFAPLLFGPAPLRLRVRHAAGVVASRRTMSLGFGPFPIVFSTNLFLWFKDDWFSLQFAAHRASGFLGKAFVRWERDGKRVHIFNPSAFTLALFSLVLLATGTTASDVGPGNRYDLQPGPADLHGRCSSSAWSSCTSSRSRP